MCAGLRSGLGGQLSGHKFSRGGPPGDKNQYRKVPDDLDRQRSRTECLPMRAWRPPPRRIPLLRERSLQEPQTRLFAGGPCLAGNLRLNLRLNLRPFLNLRNLRGGLSSYKHALSETCVFLNLRNLRRNLRWFPLNLRLVCMKWFHRPPFPPGTCAGAHEATFFSAAEAPPAVNKLGVLRRWQSPTHRHTPKSSSTHCTMAASRHPEVWPHQYTHVNHPNGAQTTGFPRLRRPAGLVILRQ